MDLHLSGGEFTWFRHGDRNQWSRLNRFFTSTDWEDCFSGTNQLCLPRVVLDHVPLLLGCGGIVRGISPFTFENMWLKGPGFLERVRLKWGSYSLNGNPGFILAKKLKYLKEDLKAWIREVFGNIGFKIKLAMEEISILDEKAKSEGLNEEEDVRRTDLRRELGRFLLSEEICGLQQFTTTKVHQANKSTEKPIQ